MYRIKTKQRWNILKPIASTLSDDYRVSKYYVQYKYKHLPFWITITSSFDSIEQAKEHIENKLNIFKGN